MAAGRRRGEGEVVERCRCACHVIVVHVVYAPSLVVPFFAEGFFIKTNSKSLNGGPVTSFCSTRTCCCYMKPFRSIVVWAEPCFNVVLISCAWCAMGARADSCWEADRGCASVKDLGGNRGACRSQASGDSTGGRAWSRSLTGVRRQHGWTCIFRYHGSWSRLLK